MGKAPDPALPGLWKIYFADRSKANRAPLIAAYLPHVQRLSRGFTLARSGFFDRDDLVSSGIFGLADAIDRYDPELGISFENYSTLRIRGAMTDALRGTDWVPRSLRRAARRLDAARQAGREAGHEPTWTELARRMEIDDDEMVRLAGHIAGARVLSLDVQSVGETAEASDALLAQAPDPSQLAVIAETADILNEEITHLTNQEQGILHNYYWDRETLAIIGKGLHLTESRISQIRTKAQRTLHAKLTVAWRMD